MKISKIILIIILFIAFFEIGLFSSYTIVTGEIPDVVEIIEMQTDTLSSFFSSDGVGSILIKDPTEINITNKIDVAEELKKKANVDGIDLDNITITTTSDLDEGNITVNITTFGFSAPSTSSGQIIINSEPDYKITASARASYSYSGYTVDVTTIRVESILKMYNSKDNTKTSATASTSSSSKKYKNSSSQKSNSDSKKYDDGGSGGSGNSSV